MNKIFRLIDIYNNSLIANEELAVLVKKFVDDLSSGNIDNAIDLAKNIKDGLKEELTDEEFIKKETENKEEII